MQAGCLCPPMRKASGLKRREKASVESPGLKPAMFKWWILRGPSGFTGTGFGPRFNLSTSFLQTTRTWVAYYVRNASAAVGLAAGGKVTDTTSANTDTMKLTHNSHSRNARLVKKERSGGKSGWKSM
jgi:hypothetical protein